MKSYVDPRAVTIEPPTNERERLRQALIEIEVVVSYERKKHDHSAFPVIEKVLEGALSAPTDEEKMNGQNTSDPRAVSATYKPLGMVDRMLAMAEAKEKAKGKGPAARVAAHKLAQMRGEGGRPL